MPSFEELRNKTRETFDVVVNVTKETANTTSEKAKTLAKIAKLYSEINREKDSIKKTYTEIGRIYYKTNKDSPAEPFAQACTDISLAETRIAEKQTEIENLKAGNDAVVDVDIEVEAEIVEEEGFLDE